MAFSEFLIGKRQRLSWIDETSYGSGGTMSNGDIIGLDAKIIPDFNHNWQEILAAGADDRYVQDRVLGPLALPFTLNFTNVDWKFLKYLGYSVADAGGPNYTHTFTIANAIQSFKLEWALRHTTDVVITLTGCVALGATISFQKATGEGGEGFMSIAMRCISKAYSIGSSVTSLSNITRTPYQWRHTKLTVDNVEIAEVNNGEIVIDQDIDPNDSRYCNATLDRAIGEPISKTHRLTGRASVNLSDSTFPDLWATGDEISNCSIEFIQNATSNKLVGAMGGFRLHRGFPPTDLESVSSADMPISFESFSSLVATDTIATY